MPGKRILILGGTRDAHELARLLIAAGYDPVSSLAGVTAAPRLPPGEVRSGGFGGTEGLAAYLQQGQFSAVVDATHPFADVISRHAHEAAQRVHLPLLRLERPAWQAGDGDRWIAVADVASAVAALPQNARVFLTIGRKAVDAFLRRPDLTGMARMIEPPAAPLPQGWILILSRPPFPVDEEEALMRLEAVTHLVTKNAGGSLTEAKLVAARHLGLPVVMIERPRKPNAITEQTARGILQRLDTLFNS